MKEVLSLIRPVPDFPKPGIIFRDITPLLAAPEAFATVVDELTEHALAQRITSIAALDARGFIFGTAVAYNTRLPLAIIRKKGKLPGACHSVSYDLEYGSAVLEISKDAFEPGARVLVVDDLLATGGTAKAACELIERAGGIVKLCLFVIELSGLGGREKLAGYPIQSLITY
jgi:adenine phosphoribosyltransferase